MLPDSRSRDRKMGVCFFCFRSIPQAPRYYLTKDYDFFQRLSLALPRATAIVVYIFSQLNRARWHCDDDSSFVLLIRWICLFYNCSGGCCSLKSNSHLGDDGWASTIRAVKVCANVNKHLAVECQRRVNETRQNGPTGGEKERKIVCWCSALLE